MIKTTVVIPNFNGIQYLESCLKSVQAQDTSVKIIVVDNGSTDGSVEYIKNHFPGIRILGLSTNTGFCHAVNEGIQGSDTPYVMLLNNDTVIKEDAISRLEQALDTRPCALAVQAKMLQMDAPQKVDSAGDLFCLLGWAFALGKDKPSDNYHGIRPVFSACGGAALYRKEVIEALGGFDEAHFAYLEDVDLGYRGILKGYNSYADLDCIVYHKGSGFSGSRHNEFKVKLSARNSIYLLYKNMPCIQLLLALPFLLIGYAIKLAYFARKGLGGAYIKGVAEGLKLCSSADAKQVKVKFKLSRLSTYISIHVYMFINIFRRLG